MFTLGFVLKIIGFVIIIGYFIYAFLLSLRVKILADTVTTPFNGTMKFLSLMHIGMAVVGGLIAMGLILLA